MNSDIRLSVGFFSHPKTIKLMRQTGAEGVLCLQRLWIWAAQNRVDGCLAGFDVDDIEIIAGWNGEPGAFVEAAVKLRFLDGDDGSFCLHGWDEHQEYVTKEPARIERARKAAQTRWGNARSNANDNSAVMLNDATSNANSMPVEMPQTKPNQSKNKNNIYTPIGETVNEDPARSLERPTGGDGEKPSRPDGESSGIDPAVDLDGPGIEFMELRDAYDAVRPEGPLDGFPEYKQLKAARDRTGRSRYPGNARLIDDFTRRKAAGFWNPGYEIGLARYLKTRLWEQPVKARASPGKPSQAEREAAEREIEARHRRLFGDRKAREATA